MNTKSKFDPCFARYISFIYQNEDIKEQLIIDVENLDIILNNSNNKIKISNIEKSDNIYYKNKKSNNEKIMMRIVNISSKKLNNIKIVIYRDYNRLNHRNHIALVFDIINKSYLKKCAGILMNIKTHSMIVPNLNYIDNINYKHNTNNNLETEKNYLIKWKSILHKERLKIRNMIRNNDFSLMQKSIKSN